MSNRIMEVILRLIPPEIHTIIPGRIIPPPTVANDSTRKSSRLSMTSNEPSAQVLISSVAIPGAPLTVEKTVIHFTAKKILAILDLPAPPANTPPPILFKLWGGLSGFRRQTCFLFCNRTTSHQWARVAWVQHTRASFQLKNPHVSQHYFRPRPSSQFRFVPQKDQEVLAPHSHETGPFTSSHAILWHPGQRCQSQETEGRSWNSTIS